MTHGKVITSDITIPPEAGTAFWDLKGAFDEVIREHKMVVIIGGGISGLSAAFRISQLKPGLKITILESSPRVGGWIASTRYEDGTIFEHGPRTLRPVGESGAATLGLVEALGLQDKVMSVSKWHPSAKNRLIYANGELHRLPSSISSVFKKMQPFRKPLYYAGLRDIFAKRGPMGDESMHSFVKRRFGPDVAEYLIDPLVRGICAGDCREISVNFLLKDLKETEMKSRSIMLSTAKKLFMKKKSEEKKSKPELARKAEHEGWSVWSLQGGLETLTDSMVDHLCNNGAEIKYDTKITSIELQGKKARIKMESGEEIETEQLISAIPAISLAPLLKKSHPGVSKILQDIKCVTVGLANFEYAGKDLLQMDAFGFLVPSSQDLSVLGVVFDTCSFPQGDKTILTVMYGGHRYQPTTPIELEEICKFSLSKTLGINEEPHRKSVQILKDCIPQYTVGHNGRVNAIDEIISKESLPIIVTGASYKGVSVNDCVLNGIRSAENLLAR